MRRWLPGSVKRGLKAVWLRFVEWLREWTRPDNHGLVGRTVADATRSKAELMPENAWLGQQLIVVSRQMERPRMSWRERGIMVLLASKLRGWRDALLIVQPDTLLRWHRECFRSVWRRKSKPRFSRGDAGQNSKWGGKRGGN
jgi:putative transposase